ncbi:MAG: TM2 domain-containing protein [Actinomycetaceae bacterium]|nr:TM2 domain-containing protein [Actinomycetaceae bacterium]
MTTPSPNQYDNEDFSDPNKLDQQGMRSAGMAGVEQEQQNPYTVPQGGSYQAQSGYGQSEGAQPLTYGQQTPMGQGGYAQAGGYAQVGYGQYVGMAGAGQYAYDPATGAPRNPMGGKSRVVAGLLGIFLGTWGIHNFYLGRTSIALTQLLVATIGGIFTFGLATAAMSVWGLVEGILYLASKEVRWSTDEGGWALE